MAASQGVPLRMQPKTMPIWLPPPPTFWAQASVLNLHVNEPETEDNATPSEGSHEGPTGSVNSEAVQLPLPDNIDGLLKEQIRKF